MHVLSPVLHCGELSPPVLIREQMLPLCWSLPAFNVVHMRTAGGRSPGHGGPLCGAVPAQPPEQRQGALPCCDTSISCMCKISRMPVHACCIEVWPPACRSRRNCCH